MINRGARSTWREWVYERENGGRDRESSTINMEGE